MGVCNCSMFCCTLLYVHFSIAIILMGKRELIALLNLSSWCLVMVERLLLAVPRGCLQFVIVVFPDHTHLLFFIVPSCKPFSSQCVFLNFVLPLTASLRTMTINPPPPPPPPPPTKKICFCIFSYVIRSHNHKKTTTDFVHFNSFKLHHLTII